MEQLQLAFKNIYTTMDTISAYKLAALDAMQKTVATLSTEVDKAQSYLDRVRAQQVNDATGGVRIDGGAAAPTGTKPTAAPAASDAIVNI
jgi:hypothetical protein